MSLIWSPAVQAADAPWCVLAQQLSVQPEAADAVRALHGSGLLKMLAARHQGVCIAHSPALVHVLERLAPTQPHVAALLAGAVAGAPPLLHLTGPQARKAWLGALIDEQSDAALPLALASLPGNGGACLEASQNSRQWWLRGKARVYLGPLTQATLLAGANARFVRGRQGVAIFAVALNAPGIAVETSVHDQRLLMDARLPPDALLATGAAAAEALNAQRTWRAIAEGALLTGMAAAVYREGCAALKEGCSEAGSPMPAAHRLVRCATAISAARMMVFEAARAAQAGERALVLGTMASLSASECCKQVLSDVLQMTAGTRSAEALARLHALARTCQIHLAFADSSEAQQALLAHAPHPASSSAHLSQGAVHAMAHEHSPAPAGDSCNRLPDRVTEILDAAATAFTEQSYDATTLDYIGDAIGITKGSIYYHYRSKADLFVAVYRRAMEMNIAAITPITQQQGVRAIDRLYRMVHTHALQVMRHLAYQRVAVQGLEAHLMNRVNDEDRAKLNEVIDLRDRYQALFMHAIEQSIEAGELPAQDARMAAKPLFGAVNAIAMWYQPRPSETAADRDRMAAYLATFVVSGLRHAYEPPGLADTQSSGAAAAALV